MLEKIPHGLDEIVRIYGHVNDRDFETANIILFELPYTMMFCGHRVHRSRCHRLAVDHFIAALSKIKELELAALACNYGGIYNRRNARGLNRLSTHSWGIAIDLEPELYPLGSHNRFPAIIVKAFTDVGFLYGGDFKGRKDPMHFQLCTGY